MHKLPTVEELQEAQKLEKILLNLTPEKCFKLFQNKANKHPASIAKDILVPEGLYAKVYYENGLCFSILLERHILDGHRLHLRAQKENAFRTLMEST